MQLVRTLTLIAAFAVCTGAFGQGKQWVTVKGQVKVADVPTVVAINVTTDKDHCLSKGPLNADDLVVNAKNKGVKNVVIFL